MAGSRSDIAARLRRRVVSFVEPLLRIDAARYDQSFTLVWTVFLGILLAVTLGYGERTRLMPLVIGAPTFLMLVTLLAVQSSARIAGVVDDLTAGDTLGLEERVEGVQAQIGDADDGEGASDERRERTEVLGVVSWILFLVGLVYVLGFLVGTLVFLVSVYRIHTGLSWRRTAGYSLAVWLTIVVVFAVALGTPLYEGVIAETLF